ncbi:hypothetical protein HanRHA438_Chr04g0168171 [Helianthus annuus]|nr:hypothetical protein HanHA300_Chr04g0129911 [Helianthus annuus]KAJ0596456.1 hypothetical protein HanHA89_Chr04g0142961 [Helianthus annuus]KAJ0757115.1 hypothetical protein HanLR1_Chr04g0134871 [Helianthus annuus]KAJ0926187.1 hypothetical protein HanRHA438_Chr04g0168171 [Helianthus annuus]
MVSVVMSVVFILVLHDPPKRAYQNRLEEVTAQRPKSVTIHSRPHGLESGPCRLELGSRFT